MSDEIPKPIRDLMTNCVLEAQTLTENVVQTTANQEKAEPDAFRQVIIIKCLWEMLGDYLIEHQKWTKLGLIGVLIGEEE